MSIQSNSNKSSLIYCYKKRNNDNNDKEQENSYYLDMNHIGNSSLEFGIMWHNQSDRAFKWSQVVGPQIVVYQ